VRSIRTSTGALAPILAAVLVAGLVLAGPAARGGDSSSSPATRPVGAPGVGDSLFPRAGNGGYDALHYDLRLRWQRSGEIRAVAAITARSSKRLKAFNLDFYKLRVDSIEVNGLPARFTRSGQELTVRPRREIRDDRRFVTTVRYSGIPKTYIDPDGAKDGWIRTSDGATVLSEPVGAMTWFPSNNTPRDKAAYDVRLNVPGSLEAVSNESPGLAALLDAMRHASVAAG
jgi:aminopeptidase N